MKCPKCGYNSFECFDACKKCSHDLTEYKEKLGLKPIVFQMETRAAMVAAMNAEEAQNAAGKQTTEQPSDMFSFDVPEETPISFDTTTDASGDFFNFSDKPAAVATGGFGDFSFDDDSEIKKPATMDDAFASLLESTPRGVTASTGTPSASPSQAAGNTTGEFDLNSFSWDDTPESGGAEKKPDDDFNSLFGEISSGPKK